MTDKLDPIPGGSTLEHGKQYFVVRGSTTKNMAIGEPFKARGSPIVPITAEAAKLNICYFNYTESTYRKLKQMVQEKDVAKYLEAIGATVAADKGPATEDRSDPDDFTLQLPVIDDFDFLGGGNKIPEDRE